MAADRAHEKDLMPSPRTCPAVFTRDSFATPLPLTIPEDRYSVIEMVTAMQRELMYARRTADSALRQLGAQPIAWVGAPRYGKLKYRPLVFGSAPSPTARSSLPFDDATGDGLARRWGLPGGFHQLLGMAKLANLYPLPISDMPLDARSEATRHDLLDAHVAAGLFTDRVVILVGTEALRAFGFDVDALQDHVGPLQREQVPGARAVLAMPDPQHSIAWRSEESRHMGRLSFVFALLGARLPVGEATTGPFPRPRTNAHMATLHAAALVGFDTGSMKVAVDACSTWMSLGSPYECHQVQDLLRGPSMTLWRELCRIGIATPRDLGARCWWFDPLTSASELYFDRGRARVRGPKDQPKTCELLDAKGAVLASTQVRLRSTGLRWAENEASTRGWDFACFGLDRRLAELRGRP